MAALDANRDFRYWAFISYSHQDEAWARWLHRALEGWRIPTRLVGHPIAAGAIPPRLTPLFRDCDELPTASDLDQTVAEALRQSWSLIVVCSRAAAASRWVNEEVRRFKEFGRSARIHCVLVDGHAGEAPTFPEALLAPQGDGHAIVEPVAADLRRHGDGKSAVRLKLVAGILGIRYDKLVQRAHQRSYLRLAAITVASFVAFALLAAFTFVAVHSRREADSQRARAEELVQFMLGDLSSRLAPEGRLATLDAVGKTALAYYASQDPATLDAPALARRARALRQIGEVYDQRGQLDDALKVFGEAAASTAELLARAPDDPQRLYDHAQSSYWTGLIAWRRGHAETAETSFREYMKLADRLVAIDPVNAEWQAEVGYANSNLGTLLLGESRIDEAALRFERALAVSQELARHSPASAELQYELAQAHGWLADARMNQMRIEDAAAEREKEIAIYTRILDTDPRNLDARNGLLVAETMLGNLSLLLGRTSVGIAQLRRAVAVAADLLGDSPGSAVNARDSAFAYAHLGEALAQAGDIDAAKAAITRSRELMQPFADRDPTVVDWQVVLARSLLLQARFVEPDPLEALRRIQSVEQRLLALHPTGNMNLPVRRMLVQCLHAEGEAEAKLGETERATRVWQRLDETVRLPSALTDPHMVALRAIALRRLGRDDEAGLLVERLRASGYDVLHIDGSLDRAGNAVEAKTDMASPTAIPQPGRQTHDDPDR